MKSQVSFQISTLFVLLQCYLINCLHIFLVGDSFDRYWGHEWCEQKKSEFHNYRNETRYIYPNLIIWGHKTLDTGYHQTPLWCRDSITNDTVSQMMLFGSSWKGPYYHHYTGIPFETSYRMELGFRNYFETFDLIPDRILFHTTQWDVSYWYETMGRTFGAWHVDWKGILQNFERTTNERLDDIEKIVETERLRRVALHNDTVDYSKFKLDLVLRTTSWRPNNGEVLVAFNNIIRNISVYRNLTLYDFDYDLWSSVDYHRTSRNNDNLLFRDIVHPIRPYSYPAIQKLLSRQYSQFFTIKNEKPPVFLKSLAGYEDVDFKLLRVMSPDSTLNNTIEPITDLSNTSFVNRIPGTGALYYSQLINGTRYKWSIGMASFAFHNHAKHGHHAAHLKEAHQKAAEGDANATSTVHLYHELHSKYEQHMRVVLENLLFTTSDMMLVTPEVMDSIPSKGIMPILFNNTHEKGFTVRDPLNDSHVDHYLVLHNHEVYHVADYRVLELFKLEPSDIVHNVDPHWLTTMYYEDVPNIYKDHTLLRYAAEKTVYVVLNFTRHAFYSGAAFMSRGYDFENVLAINKNFAIFVEKMPLGEELT